MTRAGHEQAEGHEFCKLAEAIGIDPDASVDPRTEFAYAGGCRVCSACMAKRHCRDVMKSPRSAAGDFSPFCPNMELLHELLYRRLTRTNLNTYSRSGVLPLGTA